MQAGSRLAHRTPASLALRPPLGSHEAIGRACWAHNRAHGKYQGDLLVYGADALSRL